MLVILRSTVFVCAYTLYTLTFGLTLIFGCLLLWPVLPFEKRYKALTSWIDSIMWLLSVICGIKYEIKGLENIPEKPCVIMSNHQSTWETLYSYKIFAPQATVLKRELLWIPVFGWGLAMLRPIAINRSRKQQALKYLMKKAPEAIRDGFWYMVYPEGTRLKPREYREYASGSSLIACKNGFDVLPVAHNAGYCWPARTSLKYPGTITLSIGPVISSEDKKAKDLTSEVEEWIRKEQEKIGKGLET